jgi:23S rRNA (cytosine1962-C5)-methyltransferase
MNISILRLKKQEERRLLAGHLWIFSNEIDVAVTPLRNFQVGQLVRVETKTGRPLGVGYINPNTLLSARLLTRDANAHINQSFFVERFQQALALRESIFDKPFYRLVFGESDGLPGLVVDRYGQYLVAQITTAGMEQLKQIILDALCAVFNPEAVLWRNDSSVRELEGLPIYVETAFGDIPETVLIEENNTQFQVPMMAGQKTGWFYDQRDNRARLQRYVKDKRVLDVFSYVGGWGIQAAMLGAKEVVCVDSSNTAIQFIQKNAELNHKADQVKTLEEDAFVALKNLHQAQEKFDVVILDPPAFIKKRKDSAAGTLAYQRINELGLSLINANGILITSSCSLHLSAEMLRDAVRKASLQTKRDVQILEQGFQAPDHPIHPAIPETGYLKTLVCRVL